MTENSNSNDDNGAGQIAMTDDLFGWPGDGVHWAWHRCGRYEYRKVLMHSTNPDDLVPSTTSLTDRPYGLPTSATSCRVKSIGRKAMSALRSRTESPVRIHPSSLAVAARSVSRPSRS